MKRTAILLAMALVAIVSAAGAQDISDGNLDAENEAQRNKILALLGAHNLSWGAAWSPDPVLGPAAGSVAYNLNIGLKLARPVLQAPPDRGVLPNSGDGCSYRLEYEHNVDEVYTDYLGLGPAFDPGAPRLDASWGELGQPTVFHANSDVRVRTTLDGAPFGLPGTSGGLGVVALPIGRHGVGYEATTQISDLLDIPPWFLLSMLGPVDAARKSLGRELLEAAVTGGVLNYGPSTINALAAQSGIGSIEPRDTRARSFRGQRFWVLDNLHPQLDILQPSVDLEATSVGGRVLTPTLEAQVRDTTLEYSDRCRDRDELLVQLRAPDFLPVGQDIEVTWRLRDPGPSSLDPAASDPDFPDLDFDDQRNEVRATQIWRIRDTLPPIIEPPSGRVHESEQAEETLDLGRPALFDLADPRATIRPFVDGEPVAGGSVTVASPSRTEVVWRAEDRSANTSEKTQWITLKPTGSNTAPSAMPGSVSAVSFEEIEIELFGEDPDLIDGRYDQLAFSVAEPPANGEFVAPLFPFFIEDYRVEANLPEDVREQGDTDGDGLINPIELIEVFRDWCDDPVRRWEPLPRDFVRNPEYIDVTNDGRSFVRDIVTECNQRNPQTTPRIAQFDADGDLVAEAEFNADFANVRSFYIANDGFIYVKDPAVSDIVIRIDPTPVDDGPDQPPVMETSRLRLRPPNTDEGFARSLTDINAVAVDDDNLLYMTDGGAVYVFDTTQPQQANLPDTILFVGDLVPRGGFGPAARVDGLMDIAIDSEGYVYFADEDLSRIWKYSPSSYDRETGEFTPGEQVGWMGRCSGNLTSEPACDTANERSFGFACTDELCAVDTDRRDVAAERAACGLPDGTAEVFKRAGCRPGQFDEPRGIAINNKDVLYIADYNNYRIQRFNSDGMFGGEAISACDGTCFVLGDFGRPVNVSVNDTNFYVLDTAFDLLHVFKTTPVTNVEDANLNLVQNAFVTYRSNNNFRGTDRFAFRTSDGLADSAPAEVTIEVARNFRPPEAIGSIRAETPEDTPVDITLLGTDPDEDELAYRVVREPVFGTLEGEAPDLTYVPQGNFAGTDSLAFVVDDSPTSTTAATSAPAEVIIEVLPEPDDPTLSIELAERSGVAYDTPLSVYSFDPDVGDEFSITIEWGDGSSAEAATTDPEEIGERPVLYTDQAFEARVEATHAYASPGEYTVRVCVADDAGGAPLVDCDEPAADTILTRTIIIENLIELVVNTTDDTPKVRESQCPPEAVAEDSCPMRSTPIVDGDTITYTAVIDHVQLGDNRDPATGVVAVFEFPDELTPASVALDAGAAASNATIEGRTVTATISEIPVQRRALVSVTATTPGTIIGDRAAEITGRVTSDVPDPGGRNPIAKRTVIRMSPDGDADGDGVINSRDAFPGDPTESADNDGDAIGDNADSDDDNDSLPDHWERRYGLDELSAGDELLDADGDGVLNGDEYAKGTRPDSDDSDRDGASDASDNCPAAYNRDQYDLDADDIGDVCDADQFAAATPAGDPDGDGDRDYALLRTSEGTTTAFLKDGTDNSSVAAGMIELGQSAGAAVRAVNWIAEAGGASGDALAVVTTDASDRSRLQVMDTADGSEITSREILERGSTVTGMVGLTAGDRPQIVIAANTTTPAVLVERRYADDGALAYSREFDRYRSAVDLAVAGDQDSYGVLTYDMTSGVLELFAFSAEDDSPGRRWMVSGGDWITASLAGTAHGFIVLRQDLGGAIEAVVFDTDDDMPMASFTLHEDSWTALDIAAVDNGEAVAIMAEDGIGELWVSVVDPTNGTVSAQTAYHSAADVARGLVGTPDGRVGVLASTAAGAVSLELRTKEGNQLALLTAEATSPPPPPPPSPGGGGSSGGGGAGGTLSLLLLGVAALRRRLRGAPARQARPPDDRARSPTCLSARGI